MLDSGKLDIFDLKKIKINRTAKELEEAGKEMRTKVSPFTVMLSPQSRKQNLK